MSSSQVSGEQTSTGELNGFESQFLYSYHKCELTAQKREKQEGDSDSVFSSDRIVGLVSAPATSSHQYDLAFVEVDKPSSEAKVEEYTKLKLAELNNPPQRFIEDFLIKESNGWLFSKSGSHPALHVIISTGSGARLAEVVFSNVLKPLLSFLRLWEDLDYKIHVTTSPNSITELTRSVIWPRANQGNRQSIILLSGDGGVVDMVNAMIDSSSLNSDFIKPIVALIPVGTGNALANSTGVLEDSTLGAATLLRGAPKPLPLFQVTFSSSLNGTSSSSSSETPQAYGAVVFSWCMHAALVADSDTPEYRKHGSARFQIAAKEALFPSDGGPPHPYKAVVSIKQKDADGNLLPWRKLDETEHAYLLVTFASQLERGFLISPKSKPLDGKLWLVRFGPMSGDEAMKLMGAAFQSGGHVNDARVLYQEVEAIKIDFDGREPDQRWRRICVDGKIYTVGERDTIEVSKWHGDLLHLVHLKN